MMECVNQEKLADTDVPTVKNEEGLKEEDVPVENNSNEKCDTDEPLSKRQRKKLLRLQAWEIKKKEKRLKEKEKERLKRQEAFEKGITLRKGPSRKALKKQIASTAPAEFSVIIDLDFDDLMIDKDISKCVKQLLRIYTANRRAQKPIPLYFTGIKKNGRIQKQIERNVGYENWKVVTSNDCFLNVIKDKEKIVYLTSDSDNVLEHLEKDHFYVIGGLVDHNHNKGLCFNKANELGVKHARLPLSENILIKTRTVLTINQVYEIILKVAEGKNWVDTLLEVIPTRKGAKPLRNENEAEIETETEVPDNNEASIESIENSIVEN